MENILLTIHLLIAIAIVAFVLLQKSEGGALGIGGRSDGLVSARGAADFLSKTTTTLAAMFFASSLGLAWLAQERSDNIGFFDAASEIEPTTDVGSPIAPLQLLPQPVVPGNNSLTPTIPEGSSVAPVTPQSTESNEQ